MIRRLRMKFIAIIMLVFLVMLGVVFAMVLHFTGNSMEMESVRMMQTAGRDRGPEHRNVGNYLTVFLDKQGQIREWIGDEYDLTQEQIDSIVQAVLSSEEPVGKLKDHQLRYLRTPMPEGEKLVFSDTSFERSMMLNLVRDCMVIGVISLVLFFFISLLLARWAVKPVEHAWVQQKKFVADASHELKTPLTVILTNAELMESSEYIPEQKQVFAQNILTMGRQMKNLVEKLLELARVDAGLGPAEKETVDFSEVTSEAILSFEVSFFENGLTLESELEDGLKVMGSKDHLRQISEILLDNAIKYSQPGTTKVYLHRQGNHGVLSVSNPGEALDEVQLRNVFKRFYRVDQVRSRSGSFGLGLSIAWQIVHDHGGKIKAESENGMNTFTVSIPLIK